MKKYFVLCAFLALWVLSGCSNTANEDTPTSVELQAMDTVMTLSVYDEHADDALAAATSEIHRLESLFSINQTDSEIGKLNTQKHATLSPDTQALLMKAIHIRKETGGAFDCTIAPLMEAWGFYDKNYHVPTPTTIDSLLPLVNSEHITLTKDGQCTLSNNAKVDLGGIAKGYTAERIIQILQEHGIEHALISLGGNIQTLGSKPDGSPWSIGIQDPLNTNQIIAKLQIHQGAVVTSGGYIRYFEQDGHRYHHIINPHSGYPADSDLLSVSIISKDGTLADALSTALFVMGEDAAIRYWQNHKNDFDCVLITTDGRTLITPNITAGFTLTSGETPEVIA